jgi:hypothetical protein
MSISLMMENLILIRIWDHGQTEGHKESSIIGGKKFGNASRNNSA